MAAVAKVLPQVPEGLDQYSQIELRRFRAAVAASDVPTTETWRGIMARARAARGLTQEHLAKAVGTSQPNISDIESGKTGASKFVPAISLALGIPNPAILVKDEFDERWIEAGRVLRARSMSRFRHYLAIFEEEAGITPALDDQPPVVGSDDDDVRRRPGATAPRETD